MSGASRRTRAYLICELPCRVANFDLGIFTKALRTHEKRTVLTDRPLCSLAIARGTLQTRKGVAVCPVWGEHVRRLAHVPVRLEKRRSKSRRRSAEIAVALRAAALDSETAALPIRTCHQLRLWCFGSPLPLSVLRNQNPYTMLTAAIPTASINRTITNARTTFVTRNCHSCARRVEGVTRGKRPPRQDAEL